MTPETSTENAPTTGTALAAVEQVAGELREAYRAVAATGALLERTGHGCAHPAIRQATRCAEDALDLAGEAERMLSDGTHRLRAHAAHEPLAGIGALVDVLDSTREQFDAAADRVRAMPARIVAAGRQLAGAGQPEQVTAGVVEKWEQAAGELSLMTASLSAAAGALAAYTRGVSGVGTATT
ncbi:hypothetical protein AWW66_09465 [Micromonospora rosaria]|uniref:Uncharacterized protein n=1 Tax=Micromonospora rosaria TaxID=47874 RepID=A0A136PUQ7_9ACTN|nr:hypothetical protein [Micromonospora rosaria]KXK62250.1 hypothetical protein AWW66_09465 [Micromonospora rosaria]